MKTVVQGMYVLDGGHMDVDASTTAFGLDPGKRLRIPVHFYAIVTSDGVILVDSGNDPGVVTDCAEVWGSELSARMQPLMDQGNHPYQQLMQVGLSPADVRCVIYTHLHHDHAGGGSLFPHALHVVQKAEYEWAREPDTFARIAYKQKDFADGRRWRMVDGDWLILPGVYLLATPGHTPGHQSVVLWDVPDAGTSIITGDAICCTEILTDDIPPAITTDSREAMRSVHRLVALANAFDASLLLSHAIDQAAYLPCRPYAVRSKDPLSAPLVDVALEKIHSHLAAQSLSELMTHYPVPSP